MSKNLRRIMLNCYTQNEYSHGFDLGFILEEEEKNIISNLNEYTGNLDQKLISGYRLESEKELPVSLKRMQLKIISEEDFKNIDYLDSNNSGSEIYEVTLNELDNSGNFSHLINYGTIFIPDFERKTIEEIENEIYKEVFKKIGRFKVKVKKIKIKNVEKLKEKIEDLIF